MGKSSMFVWGLHLGRVSGMCWIGFLAPFHVMQPVFYTSKCFATVSFYIFSYLPFVAICRLYQSYILFIAIVSLSNLPVFQCSTHTVHSPRYIVSFSTLSLNSPMCFPLVACFVLYCRPIEKIRSNIYCVVNQKT